MSLANDILELLSERGAPVKTSGLVEKLNKPGSSIRAETTRLKQKGLIEGDGEEGWVIAEAGEKKVKTGGIRPTMIEEGVTPRQKFEAIGTQIGIKEERIAVATDIVWGGDYEDLKWVWDALGQADIRDDLRKVWVNAWRAYLRKAIPLELETELTRAPKEGPGERERARKPSREYILVDDEPVRVGESIGDYTLQDAKDILSIRALKSRFSGGGQSGAPPPGATEKISDLLTALAPYINKEADSATLREILADKLALQKQEIMSHMPQQAQTAQPKTFIEQIADLAQVMSTLKDAGPVIRSILGFPEPSSNPQSTIVPVKMMDKDGNPVIFDPETYFMLEDHRDKRRREEESHQAKMAITKSFKDLLNTAANAAGHIGEKE